MIGNSSEKKNISDGDRDKPIYLQVGDSEDRSNSFWYVIEERDVDLVRRTTTIEEEIQHKKMMKRIQIDLFYTDDEINTINKNHMLVLKQSETDEIRVLPFPRPGIDLIHSTVIAFNSRIYILGGYLYDKPNRPLIGPRTEVFSIDTRYPDEGWLEGPSLMASRDELSAVAFGNSGLFFAFGKINTEPFAEFLEDSLNGNWCEVPPIPLSDRLKMYHADLLAVSDNNSMVYLYSTFLEHHMGLSFDVKNKKWNVFDRSFQGIWHRGLVLDFCNNSYLFLYGLRSLGSPQDDTRNKRLWVYDLNKFSWLPIPVLGLVEDDTVFPTPKSGGFDRYLFQINPKKNKFAFVWCQPSHSSSEPFMSMSEIHITKFTLHCSFDSYCQLPFFYARVVSCGCYHVKGSGVVYDCVVPTGNWRR